MDFVTVTHPDLPGQPVRMARPRNGWEPVQVSLADLTKAELHKLAKRRGVDVNKSASKPALVAALSADVDAEIADPNDPAAAPVVVDEPTAGTSETPQKN